MFSSKFREIATLILAYNQSIFFYPNIFSLSLRRSETPVKIVTKIEPKYTPAKAEPQNSSLNATIEFADFIQIEVINGTAQDPNSFQKRAPEISVPKIPAPEIPVPDTLVTDRQVPDGPVLESTPNRVTNPVKECLEKSSLVSFKI